ncbi:phosphate transport system regulatory protein PhoU [Aliidongia dinghuensis]|uniref:Phosphate-specific transport system accessory protein PhoU n=1 Tax=Aliidongia dinghuensis TaxID=1867774 RepID=A0A8J2YX08_9PROT|nr:phosphate signaling complex protein PhoU [Aliidongia dinghuensis]GGF30418.1 phosphate transport system regulatory protein PhoU [Aliidongia dinghuensis]
MRELFDRQLAELKIRVVALGRLAVAQLDGALQAVEHRDVGLAHDVAAADGALDRAESEIDTIVLRLLALQQPEGADLRRLLAALRISTALERVGDHAKTVAKRVPAVRAGLPNPADPRLVAIGQMALRELADAMRAYETDDAELALDVCAHDVELDRLHKTYLEAMLEAMEDERSAIRPSVFMLYAARNFERIGDQATNIAERVHFAVRGTLPKEDRPRANDEPQ